MSRYPLWTDAEVEELRGYLRDGCNYEEAAELMGRTKCSIANFCKNHNMGTGTKRKASQAVQKVVETMIQPSVSVRESAPAKEKTLKDFSFREIIKYLWDNGYRWQDMYCLVKQKVNVEDIIKNG